MVALCLALGCDGGGSGRPPCDVDDDCAAGTYCRSGVGCDFECRLDVDCDTGQCDEARGRCVGGGGMDAGAPDAGCSDPLCNDGVYCNGVERCVDGQCSPGEPPCPEGECDEVARTCDACLDPDRDGDGFDSVACGGRDCNDDEPRIPRQEFCDPMHVDEDCDPTSVGSLVLDDGDDDGFLPSRCCNDGPSGRTCGTDCDDGNIAIFPGATDVCDGLDNDCTAPADPGCACIVGEATHCGYRPPPACSPVMGPCTAAGAFDCPPGLVTGAETETCDGLDNDCDGAIDDAISGIGTACYGGPPETRGRGLCRDGVQACVSGVPVCRDQRLPSTETCVGAGRGQDEDCDGSADEGLINSCGQCVEALPTEVCNGVDDNCNGIADEGYTCRNGATESRRASCSPYFGIFSINEVRTCNSCTWSSWSPQYPDNTCTGIDDDCDGRIDEGAVGGSCAQRMYRKYLPGSEYLITTNPAEGGSSWLLDSDATYGAFCLYRSQANLLMVPVRRCYGSGYHYIRSPSCLSGTSDEGIMGWAWLYTGLPPSSLSLVRLHQYRSRSTGTMFWFGTSTLSTTHWSEFPVHESGEPLYVVPAGSGICGS